MRSKTLLVFELLDSLVDLVWILGCMVFGVAFGASVIAPGETGPNYEFLWLCLAFAALVEFAGIRRAIARGVDRR